MSSTASVTADSTVTRSIGGGEAGAVLESITVEGEDRVRIEFERPRLRIEIDPESAPGLEWDSMRSVLDPIHLGLIRPLIARSAFYRTQRIARPWLEAFRKGPVARFHPRLEDVERWSLAIADSRGRDVIAFSGEGQPPKMIEWDGIDASGNPVTPGLTYSYSTEATDAAGNTRNFVGDGFEVPPYAVGTGAAVVLLFAVESMYEDGMLLEAASRINQLEDASAPVIVEVTAATFAQGNAVAEEVLDALRPLLLGDPARLAATTRVEERESDHASIAIRAGR
jgi:hypothetical protein